MNNFNELLLAVMLASCLMLAVSSRMLHCIRIASLQGIILGILPLTLAVADDGEASLTMAAVNLLLKGVILPVMLYKAMLKAQVKRELEPVIGYSLSAAIVLLLAIFSFFVAGKLGLPSGSAQAATIAIPTAFTLVSCGLFIVIARKKALTQVIGFLVFENGITLFGAAAMREHPLIVELGILLDVLVLVFIMGIAVNKINRAFSHTDSDQLNLLDDMPENKEVR